MYKHLLSAFVACVFFIVSGCNTNDSASDPMTPASGKHLPMTQSTQVDPDIVFEFNHIWWPVNTAGYITVSLGSGQDISGTTAKLQLYQGFNSVTGEPTCADDPNVEWVKVAEGAQGENSVTYTFNPTVIDNYGWKAHFVKGNSSYENGSLTHCLQVTNGSSGSGSEGL